MCCGSRRFSRHNPTCPSEQSDAAVPSPRLHFIGAKLDEPPRRFCRRQAVPLSNQLHHGFPPASLVLSAAPGGPGRRRLHAPENLENQVTLVSDQLRLVF